MTNDTKTSPPPADPAKKPALPNVAAKQPDGEIGGQTGPEPTRYGDWEKKGRCSDF